MSDIIEKTGVISVAYEEIPASYHNEELGMSIAPEDAAELSPEAVSNQDRYQSTLTGLDLNTSIAIRHEGVPPTIRLRSLIVEAGRGTGWAVDELEIFLTQSLGMRDPSELNLCYDACEANVADILVQFRHGDPVQRREAARSLLGIILGEPRDGGENLADLKRGLLVAAGQLSEQTRSDIFYQVVSELDEPQQQELWTMSHDSRLMPDPKLLITLKENRTQNQNPQAQRDTEANSEDESTPRSLGGGVLPIASQVLGTPTPLSVTPTTASSTGLALTFPNGGLQLIEQILAQSTPRSSEQQRFLQGAGGQALSQRLSEIAQNPRLTPSQISQGLYYAILSKGMNHPEFTSSERHYGEFRPVAAQIAGAIIARLGLGSDPKQLLKGDYSASKSTEKKISDAVVETSEPVLTDATSSTSQRSYGLSPARSLGIFADPEAPSTPTATGVFAASSAVAAGMMAIPFLNLVARAIQPQGESRSDSLPGYFVEASTTAQGDSHGGTGGQSSQGQQQDRRSSQSDQVVVA